MKLYFLLGAFLTTLVACEQKRADGTVVDTPTTGAIKILVDEGYRPIIETSIDVFDSIYRQAKINASYMPELEVINALLDDSVEVVVLSRDLKPDEYKFFADKGFRPKVTPIGHDAVAFLLNPQNPISVLTTAQLRDVLTGKITKWGEIDPKAASVGAIKLVFDNAGSSNVRYCRDTIAAGQPLVSTANAVATNTEVISFVGKQKNAIGIIGANWISDTDDKGVQAFRKEIKLLDIASAPGKRGWGPYQAYLQTMQYPYKRTVYLVNCQARAGLGQGFAAFLASDPGQRIVLKAGMLPATAPIRLVQIIKE
jgi:phosphate transport system substrate-binding protein